MCILPRSSLTYWIASFSKERTENAGYDDVSDINKYFTQYILRILHLISDRWENQKIKILSRTSWCVYLLNNIAFATPIVEKQLFFATSINHQLPNQNNKVSCWLRKGQFINLFW